MSDDDDSEKRKKKKLKKKGTLWQGANEEFFQESYPSGSGQDDAAGAGKGVPKKKSSVRRFPSYAASTRRNGDRNVNNDGGGAGGVTTTITYAMTGRHGTFGRTITTNVGYNNATVGAGTIYDNTGVLPDLTDLSIPNEQKRWEEVQKIRSLPIPMAQKRQLKTQLTTIPMLKLKGWRLLRWKQMLLCHSLARKWTSLLSCFSFWNSSIREVQVGRGTSIAELFCLIKWAFKLNLIMCVLVLTFVLLPQLLILKPISNQLSSRVDTSKCLAGTPDMAGNRSELANCCTELYYENRKKLQQQQQNQYYNDTDSENSTRRHSEFEALLLVLSGGHGRYGRSEFSPLLYGFYYFHEQQQQQQLLRKQSWTTTTTTTENPITSTETTNSSTAHTGKTFDFYLGSASDFLISFYSSSYSFIYLCTQLLILLISAWFIFQQVQLRTIIIETEDPGHKFSDLVFTGWEHNTRDAESAKFKRRTVRHEMRLALKAEKYKIELRKRTRKMQWKLYGRRLLTSFILIVVHICIGFTLFEEIGFAYSNEVTAQVNETVPILAENAEDDPDSSSSTKFEIWLLVVKAFLPAVTVVKINSFFPFLLSQISRVEKFSQSVTLKLTLWRIMLSRVLLVVFIGVKLYLITYCKTAVGECTRCESEGLVRVGEKAQCWESLFGEQLCKIVLVDLTFKILIGFVLRPLRNCIGLYCPGKFFRHLGLMKFSVTMQSLDILYIQFLSWIGVYFAPFLPVLVLIYTFLLFYLNKLTVFVTCRGIPVIYRAMRLSTIYLYLKLVSFAVVSTVIAIVLGYLEPSKTCGPFRQNSYPWEMFTRTTYTESSGPIFTTALSYLRHPITILILLLLICSVAYYYYTLTRYGRGTVTLLKNMLVLEGHDKQFLFARLNSLKRSSLNSSDSIPPLARAHGTILNEDDD